MKMANINLLKPLGLNPEYIAGFIDGEGSFNITISKDPNRSSNYRLICELHITQSAHSIKLLEGFRDYFGCGVVKVDNKLTNTMKYQVSSYKDIARLTPFPFLDKHPLLTSKHLNYQAFKEAINLMVKKEHLTSEGMSKIQMLAGQMNSKRSFAEKFDFTKAHLAKHPISSDWVRGFVDGEGCFYFYIGRQAETTIQLQASLEIAQNTHDILVLEEIRKFLGCGRLKPKFAAPISLESVEKASSRTRRVLRNPTDLKAKIIPFFDANTLLTTEPLALADWKRLIEMKEKKWHLSPEGLTLMKNIKSNMNTSRKTWS
jgi:hypothetical protein